MSVSGLCEVCQQPDVDHACDRCAQLVCDRHYDEQTGFCVECASEVTGPNAPPRPEKGDLPDGVDTYRF